MNMKCKHCNGSTAYVLRLLKNPMYKIPADPKWAPMILTRCVTCARKQGGALPQTEELRLKLDGIALMDIDFDAIKDERIGDIQSKIPDET